MNRPTFVSLFAGAGGFDIGFERAGFACLAQVEIDATARSVLARHWPDVPRYEDVRAFGAAQVPYADVVVGGFPCQDVSTAGKRKGFAGQRSSLWWEMLRVVSELQPRYVVFENVPGLLSQVDEEYHSERCLCGWDFGWGGVSDGGVDEEGEHLRCAGLPRHDGEGDCGAVALSGVVGRIAPADARADGEVGSGVDVEHIRQAGGDDAPGGFRPHGPEATAGEVAPGVGVAEAGRPELVDGRDAGEGHCHPRTGDGVEPEGAAETSGTDSGRRVCPGCGRDAPGTAEPRPAGRLTMATVVRSLQRIGYHGAWRVLDAQFFGVPQQRRRVFGCFARGDSGVERCTEILALREGVRRRTPPRRKSGQGVAATSEAGIGSGRPVANCLRGNNPSDPSDPGVEAFTFDWQAGGGGNDTSFKGKSRQWICDKPGIARSLVANKCLAVFGGGDTSGERGGDAALTAKGQRQDFDTENFVLIQDAREGLETKSQGGLGVWGSSVYDTLDTLGTQAVLTHCPEVAYCLTDARGTGDGHGQGWNSNYVAEVVPCLSGDGDPKGRADGLAFKVKARPERGHGDGMAVCVTGEAVTHSLTGEGHDASEDGTGRGVPIVFNWQSGGDCRLNPSTLADALSVGQTPAVHIGPRVRRLTPLECERLMGWPDGWTEFAANGKRLADGPRYRLCGNGVVGTVSGWIARRMVCVMRAEQQGAA